MREQSQSSCPQPRHDQQPSVSDAPKATAPLWIAWGMRPLLAAHRIPATSATTSDVRTSTLSSSSLCCMRHLLLANPLRMPRRYAGTARQQHAIWDLRHTPLRGFPQRLVVSPSVLGRGAKKHDRHPRIRHLLCPLRLDGIALQAAAWMPGWSGR